MLIIKQSWMNLINAIKQYNIQVGFIDCRYDFDEIVAFEPYLRKFKIYLSYGNSNNKNQTYMVDVGSPRKESQKIEIKHCFKIYTDYAKDIFFEMLLDNRVSISNNVPVDFANQLLSETKDEETGKYRPNSKSIRK